jgi:hypothetical protein
MKKLIYLIVVIVALGLIVTGCIPVVPPAEQNETSDLMKAGSTVTVTLMDSDGNPLKGGIVKFKGKPESPTEWSPFGTGPTNEDGEVTMELTAGKWKYWFSVEYNDTYAKINQDIGENPEVSFTTTTVNLHFSGDVTYNSKINPGTWIPYEGPMEMLPGTFAFRFGQEGYPWESAEIEVSGNKVEKSIVIAMLLNSSGGGISGGAAQYLDGEWKAMGTTGSNGVLLYAIDGLKGTLWFKMTYAGASMQKSQNIATDSYVVFQTKLVTMELLDSTDVPLTGVDAEYHTGTWNTFGAGTTTTTMELLPVSYYFRVSYAGASMQKSQNIATDSYVVFQTKLVTMELLDSSNNELTGGAEYYVAGIYVTFGAGTTTTTMELLPMSYYFRVSYAGASIWKYQNVDSNPVVEFQTGQVHSNSGNCTEYYSTSWNTFIQDMELLPGKYWFSFSDIANTYLPIVAGVVNHIH